MQPEPMDGDLILNSGILSYQPTTDASRPCGTDKLELLALDFELWDRLFGMCACM